MKKKKNNVPGEERFNLRRFWDLAVLIVERKKAHPRDQKKEK